jgi:hypothetical protein
MKKENIVITITIICIALAPFCTATTVIGVSPSRINFENVLRGGYSERIITITSSSEIEATVTLEGRGEIIEWLEFSETEFKVSQGNPHYLKITVNPPSDLQNANYTGFLRLSSSTPQTEDKGGATGTVIPVLDLFMNVQITDTELISCIARDYEVNTVEEGEDLYFRTNVLNNGNVRINPTIKIDIWDQEQIEILKTYEYDETQVFPTTEGDLEIKVPTEGLETGQYWAEISSLDCFSQATLTFDILEEGSLRAEGLLKEIRTRTWIDEGETTLIEALFTNNGEKDILAYFKGRVTFGDKTVQLIETEESRVSIGEGGKYIVSGRIFYANKRTYEKSAVINVRDIGLNISDIIKYIIYAVLVGGIIYVTYRIREERKKINKDLRRIRR